MEFAPLHPWDVDPSTARQIQKSLAARLDVATPLGPWLDLPTIGCAKSLLCGDYQEPGPDRGDRSPLVDRGEVIGSVVRTRSRVSPVYVSPGHRCDLEGAVAVTLATAVKYRLPVP